MIFVNLYLLLSRKIGQGYSGLPRGQKRGHEMPYVHLKHKMLQDLQEYEGAQDSFTQEEAGEESVKSKRSNLVMHNTNPDQARQRSRSLPHLEQFIKCTKAVSEINQFLDKWGEK